MINFISRSFKTSATANGECIEEDIILNKSHIQQFMEERGVISISKDVAVTPPHSENVDAACEIKCLIFMVSSNPLLVILRLHDRVSEKSLAKHLSISKSRLTMAPPSELIRLTGYPVGSIPPFGHRTPLYTVVDHSVVTHTHVVFGDDREYCLPTTELLRAARAVVASVSTSAVATSIDDGSSSSSNDGDDGEGKQTLMLPLPWGAGAQAVTLTAIIAQKRKIAGLLVFLTVVPPFPTPATTSSTTNNALWRHPDNTNNTSNGEPAEVQLILGKTLERRLGRVAAAELFKKLKQGDMIRVTGRPQPHVQSAAGLLRERHVVDMVVHDVEMIKEGVAIRNTRNTAVGTVDVNIGGSDEDMPEKQEREGTDAVNDEYDDEESDDDDEEEKKKRRKAELNALSPATVAVLEADMPVYELTVAVENIIVVDCLKKIEVMRSILFAHYQHRQEEKQDQEEGGDAVNEEILKEEIIEKKISSAVKKPVMTARARARAARREAETTPGTWRPAVVVGMDAEWRPITREDSKTPVSVLQIGSSTHVFLIDMLVLCTTSNALADSPVDTFNESISTSVEEQQPQAEFVLTEEERALSEFLEKFFADEDIVKVGFGLRYDFKRLVESYHLPCFGYTALETPPTSPSPSDSSSMPYGRVSIPLRSHVDALVLARCAGDGKTAYKHLGLAAITRLVLGRALDKQQQTSDWGARPLTVQQQLYAAADVTCLVDIFHAITSTRPEFLSPFWMAQLRSNLVELPQWQHAPRGGRRSSCSAAENAASGAALPWQAQVMGKRGAGATSQLDCNTAALLQYLGGPVPDGGKLSVIRVAASETLPDGSIVEPARMPRSPRGSGVLEFQHRHFLVFVNVPSQRYPNEFSIVESAGPMEEGCFMTWWPGKGHTLSHPLVRRLLPAAAVAEAAKTAAATAGNDDTIDTELIVKGSTTSNGGGDGDAIVAPTVLLFVRPQRDGYVCCGRLEASTVSEMDGQLCVSWKLLDFGEIKESPYFRKVLLLQPGKQRT